MSLAEGYNQFADASGINRNEALEVEDQRSLTLVN
jgi:hypothetical protein